MAARLTFCNDIDFSDWPTYLEVHHVLAQEFGIQAEDSFWLFDPAGGDMALFKSSVAEKGPRHDEILEEVRVGRMTILHSAGNFSLTNSPVRCRRELVAEGLAYLYEHARVPQVWTNHGDVGDIQNVGGAQPVYQQGDEPASDTYLLDLLVHYGVQYFWNDNGSRNEFVLEGRNRPGRILQRETTRSGQTITCFLRYRGPLPKAPDAETLHQQVTPEHLDALVAADGKTIVYQHWCLHRDSDGRPFTARRPVFPAESMGSLARLARYRDRHDIEILPLTSFLQALDVERAAS
jgi:hypothetical protein